MNEISHPHFAKAAILSSFFVRLLVFCLLCLTPAAPVRADDWLAPIYDAALPSHFVAVDKARQSFLFFEKKSPLKLKYTYPCTTGQQAGDKQKLNDLRTPEGVYFVDYKIASGLDFKEYGGIAYTLNYPNPVDRLRGKTGHGIWIHSKGFGIVPRDTRGCVAIGLADITEIGPSLTSGTAVILAERLDEKRIPVQDNGSARQLRRLMAQWSNAWAARSPKMFDFYDPEAYTRAMPENFAAFRQNKERLFSFLKSIKIYNREIHVLEGPGYWVTWAEQLYVASNLSTEGTRRLYWQKDKNNVFRIVGMEWIPRDMGMRADFRKGLLVAETSTPGLATDASYELPVPPRLTMPEKPAEDPRGEVPPLRKTTTPKDSDLLAAAPLVPPAAPEQSPAVILWDQRDKDSVKAGPNHDLAEKSTPLPAMPETAAPRQELPELTEADQTVEYLSAVSSGIGDMLESWRQSWEGARLDDYLRHYDDNAAQQGRGGGIKNIRRQKEALWTRTQPTLVEFSGMRIAPEAKSSRRSKIGSNTREARCLTVDMNQVYADSSGHSDKGTKTLLICRQPDGWKIHREDWIALPVDKNAGGSATQQEN
jgi:murein L,D-transpeptidase YafK